MTDGGFPEIVTDQIPKNGFTATPTNIAPRGQMIKIDEGIKVSWQLYIDENHNIIFSVLCGSIAMWEFKTILSDYEKQEYKKNGPIFLDNLARDISKNTDQHHSRRLS